MAEQSLYRNSRHAPDALGGLVEERVLASRRNLRSNFRDEFSCQPNIFSEERYCLQ